MRKILRSYRLWRATSRIEAEFHGMSDGELRDIGINRYDIRRMARFAAQKYIE